MVVVILLPTTPLIMLILLCILFNHKHYVLLNLGSIYSVNPFKLFPSSTTTLLCYPFVFSIFIILFDIPKTMLFMMV